MIRVLIAILAIANSVYSQSANFKTVVSGKYLVAENGGGWIINANRDAVSSWETFNLIDKNGGSLESGDQVFIQTSNGQYLKAENGGGGELNSASNNKLDWETFKIVKDNGWGTIRSGDTIGFQTLLSGKWISAVNGGGSGVHANGARLDAWEKFIITLGSSGSQPDSIDGNWRIVWQDEFNGNSIDESKWAYEIQRPRWVNNELQNYVKRHENARVENGNLVLEARRDWYEGHEYSSARLKTQGKMSWTYGRFEARIQLPGGKGTWPAFWMLANDMSRGWPACGEIDILEQVGYDPDNIHATTHSLKYNHVNKQQKQGTINVPGVVNGFHVYAAEWSPDRIDFFVDGRKFFTSSNDGSGDDGWPFNKPFYIILNLAVGGDWGGALGVDTHIWPRRLLVDYVRVYQR